MKPSGNEFVAWYNHAKSVAFLNQETECGKELNKAATELAWREEIARGHKLEIAELRAELAAIRAWKQSMMAAEDAQE